jgi:hypothetical protein
MYRILQPVVVVSFGIILFLVIVLLYYFRVSKEEGMWQPVYGDVKKCLNESDVEGEDEGEGEGEDEDDEEVINVVDMSKQLPGKNYSFKSFMQFNKDKAEWDNKSLKYLSLGKDGDDVVFDKNGTETWQMYIPSSYDADVDPEFKQGVHICSRGMCIHTSEKAVNLDESLTLKPMPVTGKARNTWTIKKHGDKKYTVCTNVNVTQTDGSQNRTTLCMLPFIYGEGRRRLNLVLAEFADDYDPKPNYIWQIDGLE